MRSIKLAQKLQKSGINYVYNFNGSIFAWANQGLPLYQGKNQVFVVHPYDNKWGQLLKQKYRANL